MKSFQIEMATAVYKFRIEDDNGDVFETDYLTEAPETSPNSRPVVNVTVLDSVSSDVVIVHDDIGTTQGLYRARSYKMDVTSDPVTSKVINFPFPVRIYSVTLLPDASNIGDCISCTAAKDMMAGPIMAELAEGGNSLVINPVALPRLKLGFTIGVGPTISEVEEELGEIIAIDKENNVITFAGTAGTAYPAGTKVFISVPRLVRAPFRTDHPIILGGATAGGSESPVEIAMTVDYENNSGEAKEFYFIVEHKY